MTVKGASETSRRKSEPDVRACDGDNQDLGEGNGSAVARSAPIGTQ